MCTCPSSKSSQRESKGVGVQASLGHSLMLTNLHLHIYNTGKRKPKRVYFYYVFHAGAYVLTAIGECSSFITGSFLCVFRARCLCVTVVLCKQKY